MEIETGKMPETMVTIYSIIEKFAKETPKASAICAPKLSDLSYEELFKQIKYVGSYFQTIGINRNDRIAIVVPNGPEMAVSFLSVASYTASAPLNPAYTRNDFEFYFNDLEIKALILPEGFDSPARQVAEELKVPVIEICKDLTTGAGAFKMKKEKQDLVKKAAPANAEDVGLVLHTSGTTSKPKMVPLTNGQMCVSAKNIRGTLQLEAKDRCLNVMPLFHIHGLIGATLTSISAGASLFCSPGFDSANFFDWIKEKKPTWYTAVPTIHQAVLSLARKEGGGSVDTTLRFIRSSSASLPPTVMKELEDTFGIPVIESYGMTEASHQMASNPLPPMQRKAGSVGLAAGPDIALIDENGNLKDQGKGEIVIRGENVMNGYVNNPEANVSSFVNGWFKTGDEGKFDEDGYLFLTGRLKEIINRAGENISPREIDEVLMQHPEVKQAVAFALPHPTLGEDVGAVIVLNEGASASENELRRFCINKLADFKIPQRVLIVDEIPKGPTGKLKRIGLADLLKDKLASSFVSSSNKSESMLVEIWQDVLDVEDVGIKDNFYSLGGDSLLVMTIIAEASRVGIHLKPDDFVESPTVEELAKVVREAPVELEVSGQDSGPYPILPGQAWVLDILDKQTEDKGFTLYAELVRVHSVDINILKEVVKSLINRHEVLRVRFLKQDGEWYQELTSGSDKLPFKYFDLKEVKLKDQLKATKNGIEELQSSLSLTDGPLMQVGYFDLGEKRPSSVIIVAHHIIVDEFSTRILAADFQFAYNQAIEGKEIEFPQRNTSLMNWVSSGWKNFKNGGYDTDASFWLSTAARHKKLPYDHPDGERIGSEMFSLVKHLDSETTEKFLKNSQKVLDSRPHDVLATALALTLSEWNRGGDVNMSFLLSGRTATHEEIDLSNTIGDLFMLAPVVFDLSDVSNTKSAVEAVKKIKQSVPSGGLSYWWHRYFSQEPEVRNKLMRLDDSIWFNYWGRMPGQKKRKGSVQEDALNYAPMGHLTGMLIDSKMLMPPSWGFPLYCQVAIMDGRLFTYWMGAKNLIKEKTLQNLSTRFIEHLKTLSKG